MTTTVSSVDRCYITEDPALGPRDVMYAQKRLQLLNDAECTRWVNLVDQRRQQLIDWVSTIHPQGLACRLDRTLFHGSYNLGQKVTFSDGTKWFVRFPLFGHVSPDYADEKVAVEVETMKLIGENTTTPVPKIKHWGLAATNPLGLGPYIMMDFIEGVPLDSLLSDPAAKHHFRLIKEDIGDGVIESLYRQLARVLLQLFRLDFDRIGSLPTPATAYHAPTRPLTLKAHDILQTGGVNTFGDRSLGFSTTSEYFQHVLGQDWEQLRNQPNSVGGEYSARTRYKSLSALQALLGRFVHPDYDRGPFKLICDDLSLASVMVRGEDDLTIVGLVDFEWSYARPAQLFGSAPWWLLGIRLNNVDTFFDEDHGKTLARFMGYLDMFKRVLSEEEERMPGHEGKELSGLVEWSESSGAMWLHMLLSYGFNHPKNLPFAQLQRCIGIEAWEHYMSRYSGTEIDDFVKVKLAQLDHSDRDEDRVMELKGRMDQQTMSLEQFIAELTTR